MTKALVVFATITGNNEDVADIITSTFEERNVDVVLVHELLDTVRIMTGRLQPARAFLAVSPFARDHFIGDLRLALARRRRLRHLIPRAALPIEHIHVERAVPALQPAIVAPLPADDRRPAAHRAGRTGLTHIILIRRLRAAILRHPEPVILRHVRPVIAVCHRFAHVDPGAHPAFLVDDIQPFLRPRRIRDGVRLPVQRQDGLADIRLNDLQEPLCLRLRRILARMRKMVHAQPAAALQRLMREILCGRIRIADSLARLDDDEIRLDIGDPQPALIVGNVRC